MVQENRHPDLVVIGGGLAGTDAAWLAARHGLRVALYEMRPRVMTPAEYIGAVQMQTPAGRFSPIIRDVSFSLTEFNRDIDGYNRKLEGVLHGH